MTIKEQIARWLAPEMARNSDRFWRMRVEMEDTQRWLGYEFPTVDIVLSWLKYNDVDYWRPLGTPAANKWPSRIDGFREWLRANYAAPTQVGAA